MANEDVIKKDMISELKDMESENDQRHLEPVNVVVGRFQPYTIGHLSMAKELEKINGLPSVYIYIRSKSGKNAKFTDKLTINYMEDVVQGQPLVRDAWAMESAFIPVIILESQRRGYNPVLIGAGEDRAKSYKGMAKRMKDVVTHPDFEIKELKGRITSATEVRQAILDDDKKKFNKLVPKQVQPYYTQLKAELEASLVESINVSDIVNNFDVDIDEMESILYKYDEDFFSDVLIIESILEYELTQKTIKTMNEDTMSPAVKKEMISVITTYTGARNSFIEKKIENNPNWDWNKITSALTSKDKKEKKKVVDVIMGWGSEIDKKYINESINEAAMSKDTKKFLKGMKKIKINELGGWMPGHKYIYFDSNDSKYYFVDFEGDHMELKNEGTLKELEKFLKKNESNHIELVHVYDEDGSLFGTGELIKTKGDKSLVSFDANTEKWVKSKLVKLVESKVNEKLKLNSNYPVYHHTFGSALDAISAYAESGGYNIDQQEFFTAFGDAFFKPKKGKTLSKSVELQDKNGNVVGVLHSSIYNRGVDGKTYELTMYSDQTKKGLRESVNESKGNFKDALKVMNFKDASKEDVHSMITDFFGEDGVPVLEHMTSKHGESINKAHTRFFERVIAFKKGELTLESLDSIKERESIPYLSKITESKLESFKDALTEMVGSNEYEAKLDAAICMLVKSNRPVVWEDFKSQMLSCDFFKKDFKPFLMMQGLNDYQIDKFIENILRVKYQHYTNYFTGSIPLQYVKESEQILEATVEDGLAGIIARYTGARATHILKVMAEQPEIDWTKVAKDISTTDKHGLRRSFMFPSKKETENFNKVYLK